MKKDKLRLEEEADMKRVLDRYQKSLDEMASKTNWEWYLGKDELITLILETKFLVRDFVLTLERIEEKQNG